MAKTRNIALNAAGGAQIVIRCTIPCRRMEIIEDNDVNAQGLIWQDMLDAFAATKTCSAQIEPLIFQQDAGPQTGGRGRLLGYGPQTDDHGNSRLGTAVFQGTSAGLAITVRVTEYEA